VAADYLGQAKLAAGTARPMNSFYQSLKQAGSRGASYEKTKNEKPALR
jgi:hypothetical protein